jgi:hypothetical protein
VIGAGDGLDVALAAQQLVRAMAADVVEGLQVSLGPPDRKEAHALHVEGDVVPLRGERLLMADELPGLMEDGPLFRGEIARLGVAACGQREGTLRPVGKESGFEVLEILHHDRHGGYLS